MATVTEESCGHFFVGFGEGLITKSPVVFFAKTQHTAGDDRKAIINAHNVRVMQRILPTATSFRRGRLKYQNMQSSDIVPTLEAGRLG